MEPLIEPTLEERLAELQAVSARQQAWFTAAALLGGLILLNTLMVIYTRGPFSALFVVANGANLILVVGLLQMRSWARFLTILRAALGIGLALVGMSQTNMIDLAVTIALFAGIALPLVGPPHIIKNIAAALLFAIGVFAAMAAVVTQLVIAG
jgi:hypothetical protein